MALKLLTALTVVIFISFTYKVWDKTKVPWKIHIEDVWKVKTIEFAHRISQKSIDFVKYFEGDIYKLRPYQSFLFNSLHFGIWPFSTFYLSMNESLVAVGRYRDLALLDDLSMDCSFVVHDRVIAGVPVLMFRHVKFQTDRHRPVLIYFHSGGWEWLGPDDPSPTLRSITRELGMTTISVDYRLTPEHPYPAAFHDCLKVTEYVLQHHRQLGIDPNKVVVGGDNSGGNLAAAVALKLKKKLRLQVLIYPVLQAFDFQMPSYVENRSKLKYIMKPEKIVRAITMYGGLPSTCITDLLENRHLSSLPEFTRYREYINSKLISNFSSYTRLPMPVVVNDEQLASVVKHRVLDPFFMPLMAQDLNHTTDAYIVTAQHDVLRDDGILYAKRLQSAIDVKVKHQHYVEGFHDFFHYSEGPFKLELAHQALFNLIHFLKANVIFDSFDK